MPSALLPLVILTEVTGLLVIILGWKRRVVAFLLSGYSLLTALLFHLRFSDELQ